MRKILIFSLWCSISVFSKTEIYFVPMDSPLGEWLSEVRFPALFLRLDAPNDE